MGKGSKRRPMSCTKEEYENRFNEIFGKKTHWWESEEHKKWVKQSKKEKKNQE